MDSTEKAASEKYTKIIVVKRCKTLMKINRRLVPNEVVCPPLHDQKRRRSLSCFHFSGLSSLLLHRHFIRYLFDSLFYDERKKLLLLKFTCVIDFVSLSPSNVKLIFSYMMDVAPAMHCALILILVLFANMTNAGGDTTVRCRAVKINIMIMRANAPVTALR